MIRAELDDLGPHNGMGEPDAEGSYRALRLSEAGHTPDEEPQSLTFLVPSHSLGLHSLTEELEAVRDTLTSAGIVEIAARNPSVMEYMRHWEARAEKAEAELEAARAEREKMHRRAQEAEGRADALQERLDAAEYRPTNQDVRYWRRAKAAEADRDALAKSLRRIASDTDGDADLDEWGAAEIARAALARLAP
jgi:chromosome segregation ATPase